MRRGRRASLCTVIDMSRFDAVLCVCCSVGVLLLQKSGASEGEPRVLLSVFKDGRGGASQGAIQNLATPYAWMQGNLATLEQNGDNNCGLLRLLGPGQSGAQLSTSVPHSWCRLATWPCTLGHSHALVTGSFCRGTVKSPPLVQVIAPGTIRRLLPRAAAAPEKPRARQSSIARYAERSSRPAAL